MEQNATYKVFLRNVFAELETQEVNYTQFVPVTARLTAEFARAYYILYDNRKKVIRRFTHSDNFDNEAAALFLHECEARPTKPTPQPDTYAYNELASIANRLHIFSPVITGEDLLRFRSGASGTPLQTSNMAKAVFFLSMLALHEFIPHNWKTRAIRQRLLLNTRTGKVPTAQYLRSVASQYNVPLYKNITMDKEIMKFNQWDEIALSVRNVKYSVTKP